MHYDPERITFFAKTDARGKEVPFGIKAKDRSKHMYVIGKTGMGKSTMLENMAIQDMQNGEGMAFIDPHGSTAEKLLDYIPEERIKDVLYFAPFDMDFPVAFNVMEDVGYDRRHLVVSGLMSTFKKIWVDAWSARMEYILSNTLLALLEYPGSTLLGVNRMLSDKDYRNAVVANVKDPGVKSFWVDEFAKYNDRYMQEAGDAIKNKIGQFTTNPVIRNIVGQERTSFDVRKMMDERKIFIVNLSKGLVGESNANLLGSMLITRIYLAAMSRADVPASEMARMPNFYFYVDEFQSFANETFANILSEARKYKLNLTIAHQYIEQMEEDVRNAVFGNVGTTIAFRVGPFDAEVLETIFSPQFLATDIVNLGFAQIYLTLMIDGIGSPPFSAMTLPPIAPAQVSHRDRIIAASRAEFAHRRPEVEAAISSWHEPIKKPDKPERTEKSNNGNGNGNGAAHRLNGTNGAAHNGAKPQAPRNGQPAAAHRPAPQQVPAARPEAPSQKPREERQSSASREQVPKRPPVPEKSLADLRSVLATITQKEADRLDEKPTSAGPDTKGGVLKAAKQEKGAQPPEAAKADLRAALQSVLSSAPKAAEPAPTATPQAVPQPAKEAPARATAQIDGRTAVSVRELEDMLKLGKKDRPPV